MRQGIRFAENDDGTTESTSEDQLKAAAQQTVFLVGFMGAGKTSVGRALAAKLGCKFIDLDHRIEVRERRTIADIFQVDGEPAFRKAEAAALQELLTQLRDGAQAIVALGGGAFVQPENARLLQEFGAAVVFLDAPVDELRRRCRFMSDTRPLYTEENQFRQLYEARRGAYMAAGLRVDTADKTVAQVATEVANLLGLGEKHETPQT